jgi:hypothetical protein
VRWWRGCAEALQGPTGPAFIIRVAHTNTLPCPIIPASVWTRDQRIDRILLLNLRAGEMVGVVS